MASGSTHPTSVRRSGAKRGRRGCLGLLARGALVLLVLVLALGLASWATMDRSEVGHFTSPAAEASYLEAYDVAMRRLPPPTRTVDVATSYGTVRGYLFETPDTRARTPIVLAPGRSTPTPMWAENLPGLMASRPVWAFDVVGDAGRSVQKAPLRTRADEVGWMHEALTELGLTRVHLVGHSFGGYLATVYALAHPERVASLSLLDPAVVLAPLPAAMVASSLPASLPFLPASWRHAMLERIGGSPVPPGDPLARLTALGMEHYRLHLPPPPLGALADEELRGVKPPTLALVAERSVMLDASEATSRGQQHLSNALVILWPGASHSIPMEFPREVNAAVLRHVDAHDQR